VVNTMTNSDEQKLLQLIARYRVVTRGVVAVVAGSEAKGDKLLARLSKTGLVTANRGLPGNRSIYQLSRKGAGAMGVGESRARVHGTQAILKHLGVLLFCYGRDAAYRLDDAELKTVSSDSLPAGVYCIAKTKGSACVFHCYVPSPTTSVETAMRRLTRTHADLIATPGNRRLVQDGRIGLVVLVDSSQRRRALMEAVRRADSGQQALVKQVRVNVEVVSDLRSYLGGGTSGTKAASTALLWEQNEGTEEGE
jgi:hypothetical protein